MRRLTAAIILALLLALPAWAGVTPATLNLVSYQGETFSRTFTLKDATGAVMNLTGHTFQAMVRATYTSTGALQTFAVTLSPAAGTVTVTLTPTQTAALAGKAAVWDLKHTEPGGAASFLLRGTFTGRYAATR